MRLELFIAFTLSGVALSGPARRDCGQEKCYKPVNKCGVPYGGCWTGCAGGIKEIPTFTVPPCPSNTTSPTSIDAGNHTQTSGSAYDVPSPTDGDTADASTTTPRSLSSAIASRSIVNETFCPLWLCIDYWSECGEESQMWGGCYDTCFSAPPFESPLCTLSLTPTESGYATNIPTPDSETATATGYATNIPTHEPGYAYTEKPASDTISPALDDSKALVMAELPNPSESAPAPEIPIAGELRVAHAQAEVSEPEPQPADSNIIEAPAVPEGGTMRGNAILKLMADKDRTPNTPNVPCYDEFCKEAQLGPPQASESSEA